MIMCGLTFGMFILKIYKSPTDIVALLDISLVSLITITTLGKTNGLTTNNFYLLKNQIEGKNKEDNQNVDHFIG